MAMASGDKANGDKKMSISPETDPNPSFMDEMIDDPNLIRVYGVGEFDLYVEASPLAAAELVAELHKRGVAVKPLAPTEAPEAGQ